MSGSGGIVKHEDSSHQPGDDDIIISSENLANHKIERTLTAGVGTSVPVETGWSKESPSKDSDWRQQQPFNVPQKKGWSEKFFSKPPPKKTGWGGQQLFSKPKETPWHRHQATTHDKIKFQPTTTATTTTQDPITANPRWDSAVATIISEVVTDVPRWETTAPPATKSVTNPRWGSVTLAPVTGNPLWGRAKEIMKTDAYFDRDDAITGDNYFI